MFRFIGRIVAVLVLVAILLAAAPAQARPLSTVVQQRDEGRIVDINVDMRLENRTGDEARDVMVVLPPMVMDRAGTQRVLSVTYLTRPTSTRLVSGVGQEATYILPLLEPGAAVTIKQKYTVELSLSATPVLEDASSPAYLQPEPGVESDHPSIVARAAEVTAGLKENAAKAQAITRFVSRHIDYRLNSSSRNLGALAGFLSGEGVCSEYAGLFVAMARASGVPARLVYGWARDGGLEGALESRNRHVWAEYYDEERGWIPVDPTFAIALPLEKVMYFDGLNHLAQSRVNASYSVSYGGNALLSIRPSTQLVTTTTLAPVPDPAPVQTGTGPRPVPLNPVTTPSVSATPAPTVAQAGTGAETSVAASFDVLNWFSLARLITQWVRS